MRKFPAITCDVKHGVIVTGSWKLNGRSKSSSSGSFFLRYTCKIDIRSLVIGLYQSANFFRKLTDGCHDLVKVLLVSIAQLEFARQFSHIVGAETGIGSITKKVTLFKRWCRKWAAQSPEYIGTRPFTTGSKNGETCFISTSFKRNFNSCFTAIINVYAVHRQQGGNCVIFWRRPWCVVESVVTVWLPKYLYTLCLSRD